MSEFHPNRTSAVKTKLGLTRRRLLESWPVLVWLGVACLASWGYTRGRIFSRMNGAIDVYQENISSSEDGRVMKIHVKRGDEVKPGTIVATMDTSLYERELNGILRGAAANRYEDIARLERQLLDLQAELRKLEISDAGDKARVSELLANRDRLRKASGLSSTPNAAATKLGLGPLGALAATAGEKIDDLSADIAELQSTQTAIAQSIGEVRNSINILADQITKLRANAEATIKADFKNLTPAILAGLRDDEQKNVNELISEIERCSLRTTRGSIDRLEKEEGEYAAKGESVLRVVAEPDQIIAFLPQDQIGKLQIGDTVYITPAMDRALVFPTKVTAISPRMNNLADATSPLPNRRIYGRDVVCAYPPEAKGIMVPGETVTVHLQKPGSIPLMNRIFHNDDPQ